uniref:NmrA-like domain-containing protein n=1 Tax=Helminthora furcellata TaxID=1884666 RepID=A0A1G4NZN9_9FLOR|nr:Hypothetical protein ycf39 [Helminthora furcellata]SCW21129.1 Hypothetical protein ycf39 [Helminthora furcellata]SCW23989.1 Hypothetical protein ycf39 [Helminthora furcellata]
MSLLVIGATGTLGRQVVRKALDEGFTVTCLVRNFRRAAFLKEWGAILIYGDLKMPETIPRVLKGITAIIDASTARPYDPYNASVVDLYGKIKLIEAAEIANIKRFIFFSILNADNYSDIPLMNLKLQIENRLRISKMPYTIFNLCGFYQGIISQYALPILDQQSIWVSSESSKIAYLDTQDIARFTIRSLSIRSLENKQYSLAGKKSWNSFDIIELCEKLSGQRSQISKIPLLVLQIARDFTGLFEWTKNISERLAFAEILSRGDNFVDDMTNIYKILQINPDEVTSLEDYLQEYFTRVMKKLKTLNYEIDKNQQDVNF